MNKEKHAFIVAIARRLSVGAALVENEVAYRAAKTGDIEPDGYVLVRIPWGELTDKFEYMTGKIPVRAMGGGVYYVPDPDEQTWLAELEDAGIIAIWNFTGHTLQLPDEIIRQKANLAGDLAVLSVKLAARLREMDLSGEEEGK